MKKYIFLAVVFVFIFGFFPRISHALKNCSDSQGNTTVPDGTCINTQGGGSAVCKDGTWTYPTSKCPSITAGGPTGGGVGPIDVSFTQVPGAASYQLTFVDSAGKTLKTVTVAPGNAGVTIVGNTLHYSTDFPTGGGTVRVASGNLQGRFGASTTINVLAVPPAVTGGTAKPPIVTDTRTKVTGPGQYFLNLGSSFLGRVTTVTQTTSALVDPTVYAKKSIVVNDLTEITKTANTLKTKISGFTTTQLSAANKTILLNLLNYLNSVAGIAAGADQCPPCPAPPGGGATGVCRASGSGEGNWCDYGVGAATTAPAPGSGSNGI